MGGHPDTWPAPTDPTTLVMPRYGNDRYMFRKEKWRKVLPAQGDGVILEGAYVSRREWLIRPKGRP
jgi:hypothetical protein